MDLAENQLALNQSVIIDGVFARKLFRTPFIEMAVKYNVELKLITCVCSNAIVHKERVLSRKRNITSLPKIDWGYVEGVRNVFVEWEEYLLALDSMINLETNLSSAKDYITILSRTLSI